MRPSNNPDIALAQEWWQQLDTWLKTHSLRGYDPFDVKQHPWIRAAQPYYFPRRATTALCDLFPKGMRRLLRLAPSENPKAFALTALGAFRMGQLTREAAYLDRGLALLERLKERASPGYAGLCWGYPFDIYAKGLDTPRDTPVAVVSAIAGEAFLLAHEITGEAAYLDAARSIAGFFMSDLPRLEADDGTHCFAYTPLDRRRIHNANLLVAGHLIQVGERTGETALIDAAAPALRFTIDRQREDGAWAYGEYREGDPFEPGLLALVDHHHTGFVLRSLHGIHELRPDLGVEKPLKKAFQFYRTLSSPAGMPLNEYGAYPVDIHACAEAILCGAQLSKRFPPARNLAILTLRWTYWYLRNPVDGAPWYRKYPYYTSRIVFPRWSVAWMYRAMAEYLYTFYEELK
jgi:hypothetical protein